MASQEAAAQYEKFHSKSSQWAWKFRILQANALIWQGLYGQALSLLSSEPSPTPTGELEVEKYRLEALAYTSLPNFERADISLRKAEGLCATSPFSACTNVGLARGGLEMAHGRLDEAESAFRQTLALGRARDNSFAQANALLSLGWVALQKEHFDEAQDWDQAADELSTSIGAAHIAQAALGNQGWDYYKLGEPEKALPLLLEASRRAHEIGADTYEVTWLTTTGVVYLDSGNYVQARDSYNQALDLAKRINSQQDLIDTTLSLALVAERTGHLDEARDYADKTIALVPPDGNRLDVLYPMLVKGHVDARLHDTAQAEKIFREIDQDPKSHIFLRWEAEHSLAQLYEDENKSDSADQEYRAALGTFETARSSLKHEESELPFPANASAIYDDYVHFLVSRNRTEDALAVAEYQRGRTLAEGLGLLKKDQPQKGTTFKPEGSHAEAIARRAGGTILFYWLGEKQSYLWAISSRETKLFTLPPKSEIDPMARRYSMALADQQEFLQTTDADGRALYRTLVAPAAALLPKGGKVFIIPDGSLNSLNFETLLVEGADPNAAPHYWIEDATIADASSLRLLAAAHLEVTKAGSLLLLGDAVAPNADYPQLRNAPEEMASIEKHFPAAQQRVFTRDGATPVVYLGSKPQQFSYVHFVAHGTASRMSPLDSAIVLSKSNAQEDSFKLYARDIIQQPLHAELVTISTCYGAGARAYSGEGLVGLSWAFLRAGAHNVIGALWEVSDVSTPQLMDELYGELKKGESPEVALRAAKLSLIHSGGAYRKPFYWAPFQLYTGS